MPPSVVELTARRDLACYRVYTLEELIGQKKSGRSDARAIPVCIEMKGWQDGGRVAICQSRKNRV